MFPDCLSVSYDYGEKEYISENLQKTTLLKIWTTLILLCLILSYKTPPGKSHRKNPEKVNPQMKKAFNVIVVISRLYLGLLKE